MSDSIVKKEACQILIMETENVSKFKSRGNKVHRSKSGNKTRSIQTGKNNTIDYFAIFNIPAIPRVPRESGESRRKRSTAPSREPGDLGPLGGTFYVLRVNETAAPSTHLCRNKISSHYWYEYLHNCVLFKHSQC